MPPESWFGPPVRLGREADALELLAHAPLDLVRRHLLALEAEADVLADAQVREQRVALEDGVGRPLVGGQAGHVLAVDQDLAGVGLLEAGDHPQGRRLAAARGAEQGEELAAGELEVEVVDGDEVAEALRDPFQPDAGLRAPGLTRSCSARPSLSLVREAVVHRLVQRGGDSLAVQAMRRGRFWQVTKLSKRPTGVGRIV